MGDLSRVGGYFTQAGIDMPAEHLRSCDSSKIGKPDPEAYRPLLKQLSSEGSMPWFAAAHMWDVSAARRTGYVHAFNTPFRVCRLTVILDSAGLIVQCGRMRH